MIIMAGIMVLLGILLKYGKMYFLIAGYNTMSEAQQKQYDIKGIAAMMAHVMFAMAFVVILGYFGAQWLDNPDIEIIATGVAVGIGIPYALIRSNSSKYKIKDL